MSYSCMSLPLIWQCQRDLSSFSHSFHNLILSSNMQLVPSSPSAYQAGWLLQLSLCNPFSHAARNEYVHFEDLGEEGHRQSTLNSITRVKVNDSAQWSEAFSLLQIKSGCHSWQCRLVRGAGDRTERRWCHSAAEAVRGSPWQIWLSGSPRPLIWLGGRKARLVGSTGCPCPADACMGAWGGRCHQGKEHLTKCFPPSVQVLLLLRLLLGEEGKAWTTPNSSAFASCRFLPSGRPNSSDAPARLGSHLGGSQAMALPACLHRAALGWPQCEGC